MYNKLCLSFSLKSPAPSIERHSVIFLKLSLLMPFHTKNQSAITQIDGASKANNPKRNTRENDYLH